jgi:FMN-dependent NADH-azoreductase
MDHLVPYLNTIFGGFIGVDQVKFINVHPVKWGTPEMLSGALRKAKAEISRHVRML